MTDIIESLTAEHREVEALFARYAEAADDVVADEICDALTLHAEVEAQVLYPEVRRIVDGGDDLVNDAEAEHAAIRALVQRIYESPPPDLRPLIDELRTSAERHFSSEEAETFPQLRECGADTDALGRKADAARAEAPSRSSGQVG